MNFAASLAGVGGIQAFKTMRTLRALRPLRAMSRMQGMRVCEFRRNHGFVSFQNDCLLPRVRNRYRYKLIVLNREFWHLNVFYMKHNVQCNAQATL